jgi:S1-C subfamily serine protease
LVITCAHLFREGTGAVSVTFPDQATFAARVEKIDADADLAALSIPSTTIEPVTVATAYPRRGDSLVSCGYGGDGRLWCNRGQALGYVATGGGQNLETLELSGAAR